MVQINLYCGTGMSHGSFEEASQVCAKTNPLPSPLFPRTAAPDIPGVHQQYCINIGPLIGNELCCAFQSVSCCSVGCTCEAHTFSAFPLIFLPHFSPHLRCWYPCFPSYQLFQLRYVYHVSYFRVSRSIYL